MAYDPNNLSALTYANGFTHWHYRSSTDGIADIQEVGYFNDASSMFRPGDQITVNAVTSLAADSRTHADGVAFVKDNTPGKVRITMACWA